MIKCQECQKMMTETFEKKMTVLKEKANRCVFNFNQSETIANQIKKIQDKYNDQNYKMVELQKWFRHAIK